MYYFYQEFNKKKIIRFFGPYDHDPQHSNLIIIVLCMLYIGFFQVETDAGFFSNLMAVHRYWWPLSICSLSLDFVQRNVSSSRVCDVDSPIRYREFEPRVDEMEIYFMNRFNTLGMS